jgi:hypothetical protein
LGELVIGFTTLVAVRLLASLIFHRSPTPLLGRATYTLLTFLPTWAAKTLDSP